MCIPAQPQEWEIISLRQPKGATSEGDVKQKQHVEKTPLTRFWESWDGSGDPARAFARLDEYLDAMRRR